MIAGADNDLPPVFIDPVGRKLLFPSVLGGQPKILSISLKAFTGAVTKLAPL